MKHIFYIILLLIPLNFLSANTLFFEDINLERSKTYDIPFIVEDNLSDDIPFSLEIELTFNAYVFEVNSIKELFSNQNSSFKVDLNLDNLRESKLTINTEIIAPNSTLFALNVTALASQDSITEMALVSFKINNIEDTEMNFRSGIIRIENLLFDIESTISNIYPNPFYEFGQIDINLTKSSKLEIKLVDNKGKSLAYDIVNDNFYLQIVDANNIYSKYKDGMLLESGKYRILINPRRAITASGVYRCFISLNNKIIYKNFIYGG